MKNQAMVRTQIYLTRREHESLRSLAKRTGRAQSEIIRAAVDLWLEQKADVGRARILEAVAGLWRERTDLPDFSALRREADRVRPARRQA
ncbi:MAG TPA: ribbon-helix-helix protein, CopG family [Candidatus Binataceae bacterium]|nr:ribbon-helix-helix protein, CopG family [Candidatus Binataceae bacterium]